MDVKIRPLKSSPTAPHLGLSLSLYLCAPFLTTKLICRDARATTRGEAPPPHTRARTILPCTHTTKDATFYFTHQPPSPLPTRVRGFVLGLGTRPLAITLSPTSVLGSGFTLSLTPPSPPTPYPQTHMPSLSRLELDDERRNVVHGVGVLRALDELRGDGLEVGGAEHDARRLLVADGVPEAVAREDEVEVVVADLVLHHVGRRRHVRLEQHVAERARDGEDALHAPGSVEVHVPAALLYPLGLARQVRLVVLRQRHGLAAALHEHGAAVARVRHVHAPLLVWVRAGFRARLRVKGRAMMKG
mmetsp:Transcript_26412/g.82341  ORF Transcript_26412/g.82341 Transcript_26412/m.82341 type:complete len:302 (-) Transcript_26412:262-1167(-)